LPAGNFNVSEIFSMSSDLVTRNSA